MNILQEQLPGIFCGAAVLYKSLILMKAILGDFMLQLYHMYVSKRGITYGCQRRRDEERETAKVDIEDKE